MIDVKYNLGSKLLMDIINEKIKCKEEASHIPTYDGFDMSGYDGANYHNMELLGRFKDYMVNKVNPMCGGPEDRNSNIHLVQCRKGNVDIIKMIYNYQNQISEHVADMTGEGTNKIIFECIVRQNPSILKSLEEQNNLIEKEFELDLKDLVEENPKYEKTKVIKSFKRNIKLVKQLKKKYNNCQLCGFTFKKKNGENYNETHHIIPLCDNGKDQEINTLVVCANCHRQLHYADIDISNILKGLIIINKKEIKLKRKRDDKNKVC